MKPLDINAIGTIEFFTLVGDGVKDVKVKIQSDIPSSIDVEVREHIQNVQFGVFYSFLSDEDNLAEVGKIFRSGMIFAQKNLQQPPNPPDNRGPKDPEPDLPQDGDGVKKMVDKLIEDE